MNNRRPRLVSSSSSSNPLDQKGDMGERDLLLHSLGETKDTRTSDLIILTRTGFLASISHPPPPPLAPLDVTSHHMAEIRRVIKRDGLSNYFQQFDDEFLVLLY